MDNVSFASEQLKSAADMGLLSALVWGTLIDKYGKESACLLHEKVLKEVKELFESPAERQPWQQQMSVQITPPQLVVKVGKAFWGEKVNV